MKLTNLKITPKLGILVGVTLLGLCAAGLLAGYLMQREMLNARIDQTKSIVDMALNLAAGLNLYYAESNLISIIQQSVMNRTKLGREMREMLEKRARKKDK